ncbi:MAG TPA: ATP-dependent DNA helicase RecG, partial [Rhodospirillaceae bacterium]|nr:ATP-dependent DNA helicase RecG [Rhodospirillaceae bacterium]
MSARPHILDNLFLSVKSITGVGPRLSKLLEKLVGPCVVHLLWHLPVDVIDRRYSPPLREAKGGTVATVQVTVLEHIEPKRRGLPYRIKCGDGTGVLDLTFFNARGDYLQNQLPVGTQRVISGKLEFYNGYLQMPHPDFIVAPIDRGQIPDIEPIYPMTAGITHKLIYKFIRGALLRAPELEEWLDSAHQKRENWPSWHDAVTDVHTPQDETGLSPLHPARMRLAYDEMLANQLTLSLLRLRQKKQKGRVIAGDDALFARALESLPFKLTNAQTAAVADIRKDLQSGDRMHRLLQGDVGSGKTAVGFLSMVHAAGSGCQSALMAPTEILARQHEHKLKPLAEKIGLNVVTLTGRDKGKARERILNRAASGELPILIGTHALFQEDVAFRDLALAVIDEQHRFGVHQRLQLSAKGRATDVLVMTATPIPRTLTLTAYGDMDVSRLHEKPPGRSPIDTRTVALDRLDDVADAVARKVAEGARVYWVCPLVEESDEIDLAAATERHAFLRGRLAWRLGEDAADKVGLAHGRMRGPDKDATMAAFADGRLSVLVATTVIEVGVNVPEATLMVIEHAERFGLAQLHQLRG